MLSGWLVPSQKKYRPQGWLGSSRGLTVGSAAEDSASDRHPAPTYWSYLLSPHWICL